MKKNLTLLKIYLIAGTFTFSGGMAMLPVIERELCEKRNLMTKEELYEYTTLSQTFPGVIALNSACFVGKRINGISGMFFASLGAILPAYVLMTIATILYQMIPQEGPMLTALLAIRSTSAAFLFAAAYTVAKHNLKSAISTLIAFTCFILVALNLLDAPILILITAFLGVFMAHIKRRKKHDY